MLLACLYESIEQGSANCCIFRNSIFPFHISSLFIPSCSLFSSLNKSETPLANSVSFQLWSQCANLLFQIAPHLLKHDRYSTSTVHRNARKSQHKFLYKGKNSVIFVDFYAKITYLLS